MNYQAHFSTDQADIVEKIVTGGGPVFDHQIKHLKQRFVNADLKIVYGSTEAEPISVRTIESKKMLSASTNNALNVGLVDPDIRLRIGNFDSLKGYKVSKEEFENCIVKEDVIGEIVVSGPHVLHQYFRSDEVYKSIKIEEGDNIWHKTGDSGLVSKGQLF